MTINSMEGPDLRDGELVVRLRRLDAAAREAEPAFDYDGLLTRNAAGKARARRRHAFARGTASVLVLATVALSVWRFESTEVPRPAADPVPEVAQTPQPRLVRADTYLALAAIEEHIASIDDALTDARLLAPRGADVARLERTRADLMDSYARVRYAEMVATNF